LRYGAEKKASTRLTLQLEAVLGALQVLPFEAPADEFYGRIRVELEALWKRIGSLIAAHALSVGHILVTDNTREFSRVRSLKVENWLRP
jgi:tRNA(fMet)-specific endonuclease VapC